MFFIMTDTQLEKDMNQTIAWIWEYFEEKKTEILMQVDQKNQEIKEKVMNDIKKEQK